MTKEDLIILGNGFDLVCGLKSSYSDFYKSRINDELLKFMNESFSIEYDKYGEDILFTTQTIYDANAIDMFSNRKSEEVEKIKSNYAHLTFWDLFFLYKKLGNIDWNNIELQIEIFI